MSIAGMQGLAAAQFAGQTMAAGERAMAQQAAQPQSGWDKFLAGAARAASNFASGVMVGLQSYRPGQEYSSFAGGYLGATRGTQTAAELERERMAAVGQQAIGEELYRSQADRAVAIPGMEGLFKGVQQPATPRFNDLGVAVGQDPMLANEAVRRLMGGNR
jgi:hypothetical protein